LFSSEVMLQSKLFVQNFCQFHLFLVFLYSVINLFQNFFVFFVNFFVLIHSLFWVVWKDNIFQNGGFPKEMIFERCSYFTVNEHCSLDFFHMSKNHPQEGGFALSLFTEDNESIPLFKLDMMCDLQLKFTIRVGTCSIFLNDEFSWFNVGLYECRWNLVREVKKVL